MLSVAVFLCLLVILVSGLEDFFISVLPAVQTVPVRSLWMGSSSGRTNYREGVQPVLQHSMSDRRAVFNMTNFFFFCLLLLCFNHTELKVNPGQDAPLQCQGPRDAEITLLEWNRADLKSDEYVFMYRNQRPYESYQHVSFRGRVDLMDPSMKDGNVSVTLRNVRINDTGTYKCQITTKETERVVHECAISLTVTTPDKHTKESQTESKDGGERVKCLSVIILVLSVFVVPYY